ncbi:type I restriction-modification system subunit M [Nocardia niigatensis]
MSDDSTFWTEKIWSVCGLLRADFKSSDYGRIIMPFVLLRRVDCLLAETRGRVQGALERLDYSDSGHEALLMVAAGQPFYNTSSLSLESALYDMERTARNLREYINGYSRNIQEVLNQFDFDRVIDQLDRSHLLRQVVEHFCSVDLGAAVTSEEMGSSFEELVRKFAERGYEAAGEHFTPRDVARLMTGLLIAADREFLTIPGVVRTILDPACGTGGLLIEASDYISRIAPRSHVVLYGQDINNESWALCRSNQVLHGGRQEDIVLGNIFVDDGHSQQQFDYLLASPPFGLSWRNVADAVWREHMELGFAGRFGAGLPRINDASLLYLQHMLAKMKPAGPDGSGGSRIAVLFNSSPMFVGAPGSGESEIRRWVIENDWLEAVIALPDYLLHNTAVGTYLWILTNRKSDPRKGNVVLINAQDSHRKMRRSMGSKRKYFGPDQLSEIIARYTEAQRGVEDNRQMGLRVIPNDYFGSLRVTIQRPLRLRYELSAESLVQLADSRSFQKHGDPQALLQAIRPLIGTKWTAESRAFNALRRAATDADLKWPRGTTFAAAIRKAIGIRDETGEIQRTRDGVTPDPDLRKVVNLPLDEDLNEYMQREVLPLTPDAWIDPDKTRVGYEISPTLFYVEELNGAFKLLRHFVSLETARVSPPNGDADVDNADRPRHLRAQDLHDADSVAELPDVPVDSQPLTPCAGGDLVGRPGNWRLLPLGFGEAVTSLFVLHPQTEVSGRALCEWLNSRRDTGRYPTARDVLDTHVPVELVVDAELDDLLAGVQDGRRTLHTTISGILPNVFASGEREMEGVRTEIRSAAYEASLIGELVRPLDDPIWRAEWSYPYHAAALARRYRISTHPAEQRDGLLKLGEGLARTLGVLALSELAVPNGFTENLRKPFRAGATFGTWLTLLRRFSVEVDSPRILPFTALQEFRDLIALLDGVKDFRNDSHHSHGLRATYELEEEVEKLEPKVVSVIDAASWLTGARWEWVDRCEYLSDNSFNIVGLRLRGSHPSWEPFERFSTTPLKPDRIYANSGPSGPPVDLWPFAVVNFCDKCRARELFLLNQVRGDQLFLRSLEEHSLEIVHSG